MALLAIDAGALRWPCVGVAHVADVVCDLETLSCVVLVMLTIGACWVEKWTWWVTFSAFVDDPIVDIE